jgi:death-on-curing protein
MAAAALFHSIVHDHPFFNGNKRTALVSMLVLLDENGIMPECAEDDLFQLVLRLAQHKLVSLGKDLADREVVHVAEWLHVRCRNVEKGDRPIQWRKLRQILAGFGCELSQPKVGNRINIRRTHEERGRLGRTRRRTLSTQVKYTDEGREALVDTVKKIRRDLWLDEEHGVDSLDFYQRGGPSAAGFIAKYRKTLKRLARL